MEQWGEGKGSWFEAQRPPEQEKDPETVGDQSPQSAPVSGAFAPIEPHPADESDADQGPSDSDEPGFSADVHGDSGKIIRPTWLKAGADSTGAGWMETEGITEHSDNNPLTASGTPPSPAPATPSARSRSKRGRKTQLFGQSDTPPPVQAGVAPPVTAFSSVRVGQTPVSLPLATGLGTDLATRGEVFQSFSSSIALPQRTGRRILQRTRFAAIALPLLAVLLTCTCATLLLNPVLQHNGFPFTLGSIFATQTAYGTSSTPGNVATPTHTGGSAATPTPHGSGGGGPTPIPSAGTATVAFIVASQQISSPGHMTACAAGCDINGQYYTNSQSFNSGQTQSTLFPQTTLSGTIVATNNGSTEWGPLNYSFSAVVGGVLYTCQPVPVDVPPGGSTNYPCTIFASSPQQIAANGIQGTVSGTQVTFTNPQPLFGNGHWQVTSSDCNSAIAATQQSGQQWGTSWVQSQVPAGWQLALSPPIFTVSQQQCPLGQQIQFFTASSTTQVDDGAFVATDAQAAALARLNNSVPAGYVIQQGTTTVCTPQGTGLQGGTTVLLTCADSAIAVYNWTQSMKVALAQQVAGVSKTQATSVCNSATGVKSGSCVITINLGNSNTMPINTSVIVIQANLP